MKANSVFLEDKLLLETFRKLVKLVKTYIYIKTVDENNSNHNVNFISKLREYKLTIKNINLTQFLYYMSRPLILKIFNSDNGGYVTIL